jgi:Family of unknown function (DUF5681)
MAKSEVGYGKPPKHTRFKTGISGNPKGRPKRKPTAAGEIINNVLNAVTEYREGGRTRKTTRHELRLRTLTKHALNGDARAAEMLLTLYARAQKRGYAGMERIKLQNWLPDYPGQTGDQKTHEYAKQSDAEPSGWWEQQGGDPKRHNP